MELKVATTEILTMEIHAPTLAPNVQTVRDRWFVGGVVKTVFLAVRVSNVQLLHARLITLLRRESATVQVNAQQQCQLSVALGWRARLPLAEQTARLMLTVRLEELARTVHAS